jgi:penicillin-binding protein 2
MLMGFALLLYRLYHLQMVRHAEFIEKVPVARQERARIPGVRGEIKDRNGVVLATNKASFEVRVNLKEMIDEYSRQSKIKKTEVPTIEVEFKDRGISRLKSEPDVVAIFKELIETRLAELGLAIAESDWSAMRVHYRSFAGVIPWVYRDNLTFSEFSTFAEHNLSLPGVTVTERGTRVYPYGALACHLLGYVRLPDDQRVNAKEREGWDYYLPDDYGGAGVEKAFDQHLRGKAGERIMQKNVRGRIVGEVKEAYVAPQKGNDVYLTLDARVQYIAERALRDGKIGRGAVVVIKPDSGDILAMVSVPDFDPNRFIPSISEQDWHDLNTADKTLPLLNRAIQPFVPGSTYKVPIALAGCLAGIQGNSYNCSGSVTYGTKPMQCWIKRQSGGSHGSLGLSDALMRSCNCFFYHYGNAAGIDNITRVGHFLGLGERTGIEISEEERAGILPNPEWLAQNKPLERWSSGYTANTSIGQGQVLATPLQMASVASAVASGKCWKPHLLHQVKSGAKVVIEHQPQMRADLLSLFKPEDLELVRRGMWKVVNDPGGTAKTARIKGVEVAGKTGTAQNWRINDEKERVEDNHTLFISFAPYLNPKFAICVIVQGGKSGGGCAAPVAHRILEQSLALEQGYDPKIQRLEEVPGNFNKIEAVTYEDSALPVALVASEDGDTGSDSPEQEVRELAPAVKTTPNLRPKVTKPDSTPTPAARRTLAPIRFFKRLFGGSNNR